MCQRWCSCVHMVRCWCVDVHTWYAAGMFMCTHGTLLVCSCVHMVRCWYVHVYTWYAAGVLMCTHGTLLVCSCVHMVRCWCVRVYTWYAAGMFMCTHGTLLVCSCVHMVRCWYVHVYTWYAAGVFMCTHGTLLVCHVQRCYAWGGVGWGGVCQRWCSCVHMVRCWYVDWVQCISSWHVSQKLRCLFPSLWGLVHQPGRIVICVLGSKASFAPGHIFSESICHTFQTRMHGQEVQT